MATKLVTNAPASILRNTNAIAPLDVQIYNPGATTIFWSFDSATATPADGQPLAASQFQNLTLRPQREVFASTAAGNQNVNVEAV